MPQYAVEVQVTLRGTMKIVVEAGDRGEVNSIVEDGDLELKDYPHALQEMLDECDIEGTVIDSEEVE